MALLKRMYEVSTFPKRDKAVVVLELPSGASISKKIASNSKDWEKEFVDRVERQKEDPKVVAKDLEDRIKDNIKTLTDKMEVFFQYKGKNVFGR
jgi:gas vesicle protein